jgi:hypothetical protein
MPDASKAICPPGFEIMNNHALRAELPYGRKSTLLIEPSPRTDAASLALGLQQVWLLGCEDSVLTAAVAFLATSNRVRSGS